MDRTSEATHNSVKASRSLFLTDSHGHTEINNISSTYKLFKVVDTSILRANIAEVLQMKIYSTEVFFKK